MPFNVMLIIIIIIILRVMDIVLAVVIVSSGTRLLILFLLEWFVQGLLLPHATGQFVANAAKLRHGIINMHPLKGFFLGTRQ